MRVTFSLAVLGATVLCTPLAPAFNLQASAGTLAQFNAHTLATEEPPSHSQMMGQTDADLDAAVGTKQKDLNEKLKLLLNAFSNKDKAGMEKGFKDVKTMCEKFSGNPVAVKPDENVAGVKNFAASY